jgi:hypothetical protein
MSLVICLANSYKHQGRCIAGIDQKSGQWLRPISKLDDGRIPMDDYSINLNRIGILDVVNIPLKSSKATGHEIENVYYENLSWKVVGKTNPAEVLGYCESELLYPSYRRAIPYSYLLSQAPVRTLQLIEVKSLICHKNNRDKWRAKISDKKYNCIDVELSITDPIALEKLNQGESLSTHCLLCMSLGQPWKPDTSDEMLCYRLIAGVIELLPEIELILMEMNRLKWSKEQGQRYLSQNFGKRSRYQLTRSEAAQFLDYLKRL